jgi:hypothetical protein
MWGTRAIPGGSREAAITGMNDAFVFELFTLILYMCIYMILLLLGISPYKTKYYETWKGFPAFIVISDGDTLIIS